MTDEQEREYKEKKAKRLEKITQQIDNFIYENLVDEEIDDLANSLMITLSRLADILSVNQTQLDQIILEFCEVLKENTRNWKEILKEEGEK